jgi:DNA-binding response OmpR family regulator
VDDEAGIRSPIRKILSREGYAVIEAGSADEALAAASGVKIDLLLTDVMLPGVSGLDLARRLYAAQPGLKVLYMSGYAPDDAVRTGADPPGARFLAKPFTLAVLLATVREALPR